MPLLRPVAPTDETATDYDIASLALYAELLDAADSGKPWQWAAHHVMGLDPLSDGAHSCWRSHLDRARWIIRDGLASAIAQAGKMRRTRTGMVH
jgi:hypothetical protein